MEEGAVPEARRVDRLGYRDGGRCGYHLGDYHICAALERKGETMLLDISRYKLTVTCDNREKMSWKGEEPLTISTSMRYKAWLLYGHG